VAGGHARKDGTGQGGLTQHRLSGCHRGQRPGGRHSQRRHCLTDNVFAQHRTERGTPVAVAREGRPPGALELDVAPRAVLPLDLAEQDRTSVTELRYEVAELVPSIVTIFLAWLTYVYVEEPGIKLGKRVLEFRGRPRGVLGGAVEHAERRVVTAAISSPTRRAWLLSGETLPYGRNRAEWHPAPTMPRRAGEV
jgi:hypothetical protein